MTQLPLRIALVVAAVAVLALAVTRTAKVDHCADAAKATQRLVQGATSAGGGEAAVIRRLRANCRGSDELSTAAAVFAAGRRFGAATTLAREAVRREPDNFLAYDALAFALRSSDPAAARLAVVRAQQLNPRGRAVSVP